MENILSLDTSSLKWNFTIKNNKAGLFSFLSEKDTFSDSFFEILEKKLKLASINSIFDIDKFYIVRGPGSFTGIRLGYAVFKTLGQILNKIFIVFLILI